MNSPACAALIVPMPEPDPSDTIRKQQASIAALLSQNDELRAELTAHRAFVRLCAAIFPALDGIRPQHSRLYEKSQTPLPPP